MNPLGARVLVRPDRPEDETASGLILVRETTDPDVSGTVVALGTGVCGATVAAWNAARTLFEDALVWACNDKGCTCAEHQWKAAVTDLLDAHPYVQVDVSVGDRVIFPATSGQELTLDDERYLMLPVGDILAVVETENAEATSG